MSPIFYYSGDMPEEAIQKSHYYNHELGKILDKRVLNAGDEDLLISEYFYFAYQVFLLEYGFLDFDRASLTTFYTQRGKKIYPEGAFECFEKIVKVLDDYECGRKTDHERETVKEDLKKIKEQLKILSKIIVREYKDSKWWMGDYIEV